MTVYLRRRPLLLCSVVHTNIPLRLPLRNVIRKTSIHRWSTVASVPLVPAKAREGAGAWLLLRRCTVVAVVPLVPAKAREGAGGWLLRRRCTVDAVVPLVPDKAREGAWGWLRRRRCTVAAVVPLVPDKARKKACGWLLLRRQCCSVLRTVSHDNSDYHCIAAENTGYHSRGRRCDRCMTEAIQVNHTTGYHSRGRRCDRCMTEAI